MEDLLGIAENNLPIPNAAEWELKCQRTHSSSLTTLFHMEPSPRALKFVPSILLVKYGWRHQGAGMKYPPNEVSFRQTLNSQSRTDRGFMSRCVQTLFNAYVQATNRRRARRGPLFEGRFRQRRIVDDDDLAQVCRYVHGNPVAAGLVAAPHDWAYSNYREWIGQRRGALVEPEAVRALEAIVGDWAAFVSARAQLAGPPLPKVKEPSGG